MRVYASVTSCCRQIAIFAAILHLHEFTWTYILVTGYQTSVPTVRGETVKWWFNCFDWFKTSVSENN